MPPPPYRAPVLTCDPLRTKSSFLDDSIPMQWCPHPLTEPLYLHVIHCVPSFFLWWQYTHAMMPPPPYRTPVLTCDPLRTKSSFFDGSIPMQWCPHPLTEPLYLHVIHCVPSPLSLMAVYPCNDAPTPLQSPCTYMWSTANQVLFLWWQYTHAMMPPPPYRAPVLTCDPLRTKSSFFDDSIPMQWCPHPPPTYRAPVLTCDPLHTKSSFFDGSIPMQWCPHPLTEPLYLNVIHCVPGPLSLMAVYHEMMPPPPTHLQGPCTYMWSTAYQVLFLWWQYTMKWCPHPLTGPLYLHVIHCVPGPLSLMAVYREMMRDVWCC